MCKYCEEDKRKKRDRIINTPIVSLRIIRNNGFNALAIKSYNLEKQVVDSYQIINYCPKCRKEAGRVKAILGKYVETLDNHKGIVVKQYKPTGRNIDSIHIQQENGRIWYCPISDLIYIEEESYDK